MCRVTDLAITCALPLKSPELVHFQPSIRLSLPAWRLHTSKALRDRKSQCYDHLSGWALKHKENFIATCNRILFLLQLVSS